jgi:hypothetical protein
VQNPESGLGEGRNQWLYCKLPDGFHFAPESPRVKRAYGELGPSGAWWLRPRLDDVEVLLDRRLTAADANGGVRLHVDTPRGRETLEADRIIAGTGYRPDVRTLPFLDASLRERVKSTLGIPSLDLGFESSVRGLHFVGFTSAASFGPLMRFVYGTPFAARRLAQRFE